MRELFRFLGTEGFAILQVPISKNIEKIIIRFRVEKLLINK